MAKSLVKTARLIDTRKTSNVDKPHLAPMPVEETVNSGRGLQHYLGKFHAESGKQIYFTPEVWNSMPREAKLAACVHTPVASPKDRAAAGNLVALFDAAGPLAQSEILRRLQEGLAAQKPAEPVKASEGAKAGK